MKWKAVQGGGSTVATYYRIDWEGALQDGRCPAWCLTPRPPNEKWDYYLLETDVQCKIVPEETRCEDVSWKDHIAVLTSKLNKACCAIKAIKPFMSVDILRMIHFSYVHSVMLYGIIFWGNSHHSNIFKIIKRIIRYIENTGSCDSCRQLFKQLQILSLPSQNIFSLRVFVNKNRGLFHSNSEIHDLNTRFNYNLHLPSTNLTLVQKGVLYSGSKIYNHLPSNIKVLSNGAKRFKPTLKSYLIDIRSIV